MKIKLIMLQEAFFSLVKKYTPDSKAAAGLWSEIETAYAADERYFHNAAHLEQMHGALKEAQPQIKDWDTLAFAVFYHDVVYDVVQYVTDNDNEDRSAEVAQKGLELIGYPSEKIERCKEQILATKHHESSSDDDTNFLTDADLCILGQPWDAYKTYMGHIRKEYEVYPDSIYYAGRNNVLKNFLKMKRLFKTDHFYGLYEAQAKENIERELEIISLS